LFLEVFILNVLASEFASQCAQEWGNQFVAKPDERFLSCAGGLQVQPTPGAAGRLEERGVKKNRPATPLGMTAPGAAGVGAPPTRSRNSRLEAIQ
jgi:hypothetical protein